MCFLVVSMFSLWMFCSSQKECGRDDKIVSEITIDPQWVERNVKR